MKGYNPKFIPGIALPLPTFSAQLEGNILRKDSLREGIYADYENYTIVMNKDLRTPAFVALNIDQEAIKKASRGRWRLDSRIGPENQLDNDYYFDNPWDRGHMARRATAAWGNSNRQAQKASDDTMFYSNCCLQHENLNQDEWLELEDWVKYLDEDANNKIVSFSGPVYGELNRAIQPDGRTVATIPAGFFKVVCFKNKENKLDVRAFIMYQDRQALRDKNGRSQFNNQTYQVTISEIEELTGLNFSDEIYESNSLFFHDSPEARDVNATTPERFEVSEPADVISRDANRLSIKDDDVDLFISAALVNPTGSERENEWLSIVNYSNELVDLSGWKLTDSKKRTLEISKENSDNLLVAPGESVVLRKLSPLILTNSGSSITLISPSQERVDRVKYFESEVKLSGEGNLLKFMNRRDYSVLDNIL